MFRKNWMKWACAAVVSAALLPAAAFARTARHAVSPKEAPAVKTLANKPTHTSSRKLVHTVSSKKKATKHAHKKRHHHRRHKHKTVSTSKHTNAKVTKKVIAAKPLSKKTSLHTTKLTQHKKIALNAKGKTLKV